ncbi:thiol-activated cytolysin [Leptospira perolatii]|uniref:Thiol-activated cytolysin n=1 Tax=Leptospira perolatii TaxID=2023191 RepID=A0A2M9ZM05_9LEPT|nr:thiol-activated cytolysin family protein [Leptospira perolatii]PJZ69822.1 thiol-activated cytolysin [Leptospira perolatii]PJZ72963.1 thiol-activated cytolysin [Leptospira perolatii]
MFISKSSLILRFILFAAITAGLGCNSQKDNIDSLLSLLSIASGPTNEGPGGIKIGQTRELYTENSYTTALSDPVTEKVTPFPSSIPVPDNKIGSYSCTTTKWGASEIRNLSDRAILSQGIEVLYPGALLQGKYLEKGAYTPVTLPRSGGKIYLSGLKLSPFSSYSKKLDVVSPSNIKQAIEDILSSEVAGTAADASFTVQQVYDESHLLFNLGLDTRFSNIALKTSLGIDNRVKKNYILMKFTQKFYDVNFEDPEKSTSVFRDGELFADPEGQISQDNPPLYVSKVSFGRVVYFLLESDYTALQVKTALEVAWDPGVLAALSPVPPIGGQVSVTHEQVLDNTRIAYFVRGGNAGLALEPIKSADSSSPGSMYNAIRNFLSNPEAANYSASNPGVPIAYTLNYLKDRSVAKMSYTTVYDQRDCEATYNENPQDFTAKLGAVNDSVALSLDGVQFFTSNPDSGIYDGPEINVNSSMGAGSEHELKVELTNGNCGAAALDFELKLNGTALRTKHFQKSVSTCGKQLVYRYKLNKVTGAWSVLEESENPSP